MLTPETGSGLPNSDSYASVGAADARWAGRRVYQTQALDWPRYGVCVDEFPVPSNTVPVEVVNACIDLAARAAAGAELLPDLDVGNNQIKRDKTWPLETEYFENNTDAASRFIWGHARSLDDKAAIPLSRKAQSQAPDLFLFILRFEAITNDTPYDRSPIAVSI